MLSFIDFAPTILSLTGIEIPSHIQGKAFLGNQKIHDSIEKFKDYLMNETLIELISEDVEKLDFKEDFTIDNIKVSISISKKNKLGVNL